MSKELKKNLNILNRRFHSLQRKYGVKKIGIFGSFARGEEKRNSDIDVLVEFSKPLDFFEFLEVEEYLSKILGKKVDLVTYHALKPVIKQDILNEVVYAQTQKGA